MSFSYELSNVDKTAAGMGLCFSAILVYRYQIDPESLRTAVRNLSELYPSLASRVRLDGLRVLLDCKAGNVIDLTADKWPEGRVGNVRAQLIRTWKGSLPAQSQPPLFIPKLQADDVTSGAEPPLKLRLTHLGDGGCVLAASNWHGFLDGARLMRVLVDLSTLYRGEAPAKRVDGRRQMTPAGLADLFPDQPELAQAAREQQEATSVPSSTTGPAFQCLKSWLERPPEFPHGSSSMSYTILHLPKEDLTSLKAAIQTELNNGEAAVKVSTHDVVNGIVWCLRRVSAGLPLPGQEEEYIRDVGHDVIDFEANIFPPGTMDTFLGNAYSRVPVSLPASESGAGLHNRGTPAADAAAWKQAISLIAMQNRKMLIEMRAGLGLKNLVAKVTGASRPPEPKDGEQAVISRGFASSWERCPTDQVDFGDGPPESLVPFFLVMNDAITYVTRAKDGGADLHFTVPTELLQHTGLQQVLPRAEFQKA